MISNVFIFLGGNFYFLLFSVQLCMHYIFIVCYSAHTLSSYFNIYLSDTIWYFLATIVFLVSIRIDYKYICHKYIGISLRDLPIYLLAFRKKNWNIFYYFCLPSTMFYVDILLSLIVLLYYIYLWYRHTYIHTYLHVGLCKIIEIKRWLQPY